MANLVAIVGRPNVGKSTLFNRLTESREAITDDISGVTRDRHYAKAEWLGKYYTVIDTGGYVVGSEDEYESKIREQVEIALAEAQVILFVVDANSGITPLDEEFARVLRKVDKPVILVVNKADNHDRLANAVEFYALGFDHFHAIAAVSGFGTGELLDDLCTHLADEDEDNTITQIPKIAVVGRPNVGKSSFVNALLNEERNIVSNEAGTTRDSINSYYNYFGKEFILTDTAGIRKKAKVTEYIEFYSVMRSLRSLEESDVVILIVDATRGLEAQDFNLLQLAEKNSKGMVVMFNKWDLIEKDSKTAIEIEKNVRERLSPLNYMPIIFTSVLTKKRIFQTIEKAIEVYDNMNQKISTSTLNDVMLKVIESYPPPSMKGKLVKIKYITQLPTKSLSFAFFCNLPQYIKAPYQRYLENKMREHFNLDGVPFNIFFRKK